MNKTILLWGIGFGMLAVVLGAFGAHFLENRIPAEAMETYATGVQYQMYHALLLILVGGMATPGPDSKKWIFRFLVSGILCFSFSLYALSVKSLLGYEPGIFGWVTPIGGLLLLTGWILLAYRIFRPLT